MTCHTDYLNTWTVETENRRCLLLCSVYPESCCLQRYNSIYNSSPSPLLLFLLARWTCCLTLSGVYQSVHVQCRNGGQSHADRSHISLKSACDADKAGGVRLPGDQSGHTVYTHTDANMVDPGKSVRRGGGKGEQCAFFEHLKWQHAQVGPESEWKHNAASKPSLPCG